MSFIINPYVFGTGGGDPSGIANLYDWWEPNLEGGLSDGNDFSVLTGQANAHNMGIGYSAPVYNTGVLNGRAVASFNSANSDSFTWPAGIGSLTGAHIFYVIKATNDPASGDSGTFSDHTGSGLSSHYPFTDGNIYEGFGSTTRMTVGNPTPSLASWRVYEIISVSGEYTVLLDGSQLNTTGTNTVGWGGGTTHLGASNFNFGASGWHGQIAGIYLFSAKKSGADRTSLISYINTRFALSSS